LVYEEVPKFWKESKERNKEKEAKLDYILSIIESAVITIRLKGK
jgi:hypothetical protein